MFHVKHNKQAQRSILSIIIIFIVLRSLPSFKTSKVSRETCPTIFSLVLVLSKNLLINFFLACFSIETVSYETVLLEEASFLDHPLFLLRALLGLFSKAGILHFCCSQSPSRVISKQALNRFLVFSWFKNGKFPKTTKNRILDA